MVFYNDKKTPKSNITFDSIKVLLLHFRHLQLATTTGVLDSGVKRMK